jgi:hypothetical protein
MPQQLLPELVRVYVCTKILIIDFKKVQLYIYMQTFAKSDKNRFYQFAEFTSLLTRDTGCVYVCVSVNM